MTVWCWYKNDGDVLEAEEDPRRFGKGKDFLTPEAWANYAGAWRKGDDPPPRPDVYQWEQGGVLMRHRVDTFDDGYGKHMHGAYKGILIKKGVPRDDITYEMCVEEWKRRWQVVIVPGDRMS